MRFRGWLDLERLDGVGCLEFDERRAAEEDAILRDQIERYNQRLRAFEDNKQMDQVRRSMAGGIGVGVGGGMWRR